MKKLGRLEQFLPFVLVAFVVLGWPAGAGSSPTSHAIDLDASQYEFSPGRIEVQQGDYLVINVHSTDVVHGFYLDGYEIEVPVLPAVTERIEFVADTAGKFRFRCSVSCGVLHPFMIGELVVLPNRPFWKAVLITLLALGSFLLYLWQKSQARKSENVQAN